MGSTDQPPKWIKPQLTRLVEEAPAGAGWVHEIKLDGYRMHARIDGGDIKLLTRTGLDWSHRYRRTIEALGSLKAKSAYLDGELCALYSDGVPSFSRLQAQWMMAGQVNSYSSPSVALPKRGDTKRGSFSKIPMVAVVSGTCLFSEGWLRWTGGLPPRRSTLMHAASQFNCFIVSNHVHKVAECRPWTGRNFSATTTARIS